MEESYYNRNKAKYKKGGIYYKYKSVEETRPKTPITITKGIYILHFN